MTTLSNECAQSIVDLPDNDISENVTIRKNSLIKKQNNIQCAVCLGKINIKKGNTSKTKCGHTFCLTCLHTHLLTSQTCPLCRCNILKTKPVKPPRKIMRCEALEVVKHANRTINFCEIIETMNVFKNNKRMTLITEFQKMSLNLMNELLILQNEDEEEYEFLDDENGGDYEEDEDEDEDEDELVIVPFIDRIGSRQILEDTEDEEDDEN